MTATKDGAMGRKTAVTATDYVRSYNHYRVAKLPEYGAASRALDELVHAIKNAEREHPGSMGRPTHDEFPEMVQTITRVLCYSDCCSEKGDVEHRLTPHAPFAAEVENGWLRGRYVCDRGHVWTCGYAVDIWRYV